MIKIIIINISNYVMPEQQKVDETVESTTTIRDKKIPKKIRQSSTALEKDDDEYLSLGSENNDDDILQSDVEDLKEIYPNFD